MVKNPSEKAPARRNTTTTIPPITTSMIGSQRETDSNPVSSRVMAPRIWYR